METRIQRYKIYREEILHDGFLIDKILKDSDLIKSYRKKIDDIEPKILLNLKFDNSLKKIISIDKSDKRFLDVIKSFSNIVNTKEFEKIEHDFEMWNMRNNVKSVVEKDGSVSIEWLKNNNVFNDFKSCREVISNINNSWIQKQINIKETKPINSEEIVNKIDLINLSSIHQSATKVEGVGKKYYIFLGITSILFLIAVIVLLVTMIVIL